MSQGQSLGPVWFGAALVCDGMQPLAELVDVAGEVVEPRQLREAFQAEHALEHGRAAVLHRAADAVVAARLGDQPALDQARHGRIGRNAADARDLRPRARPQVRHDRERLQGGLRQPALHRPLEQATACLGGVTRRAEGPAARNLLQDDPAAPLAVPLRQEPQCRLDALAVVVGCGDQLLDGQRRARDNQERLQRARELIERIGGN